jgi:hypothetical protein
MGLTPLMVLMVVIGVYPRPFFVRIRSEVAVIAARFEGLDASNPVTASRGSAVDRPVFAAQAARGLSAALPLTQKSAAAFCEPGSRFSLSQLRKEAGTSASRARRDAATPTDVGSVKEPDQE